MRPLEASAVRIAKEWAKMSLPMQRLALSREIRLRLSHLPITEQSTFLKNHKGKDWTSLPLHRLEILLQQLKDLKGW